MLTAIAILIGTQSETRIVSESIEIGTKSNWFDALMNRLCGYHPDAVIVTRTQRRE